MYEIAISAYSEQLLTIVTAGKDGDIRFWDFEKCNFIERIQLGSEISSLLFLEPYPLLVVADSRGRMFIFAVRPHPNEF